MHINELIRVNDRNFLWNSISNVNLEILGLKIVEAPNPKVENE